MPERQNNLASTHTQKKTLRASRTRQQKLKVFAKLRKPSPAKISKNTVIERIHQFVLSNNVVIAKCYSLELIYESENDVCPPIMCEPFGSVFKMILKGSSFCTFGRVMYKRKTPVKFVDNYKSLCSLIILRSRIMCESSGSDFKTILKGSSFCTFGRVMYKTKTPVKLVDIRKS